MADEKEVKPISGLFKNLLNRLKPGETKQIEAAVEREAVRKEAKQPSAEARIANELMDWARTRACKNVFLPEVLEVAIEVAKRAGFTQVSNHALCAFHLGYQKALEDLRELFEGWQTGQAVTERTAPEKEQ